MQDTNCELAQALNSGTIVSHQKGVLEQFQASLNVALFEELYKMLKTKERSKDHIWDMTDLKQTLFELKFLKKVISCPARSDTLYERGSEAEEAKDSDL